MAGFVPTPTAVIFKGKGWEECDTFVNNVRAVAWKEDKVEDDRWLANYASLHMSGKALRWHSRLPPDVRRDWSKLEIALLEQWPSPDDSDGEGDTQIPIIPTPAAAPYIPNNPPNKNMSQAPRQGVIKITSIKSNAIFYLGQPDTEGKCGLTREIGNTPQVSVDVNANPNIIAMLPGKGRPRHMYQWLGIHWNSAEPRIRPGSEHWARLALVDSITMKSSFSANTPCIRITTWDISAGGDICPAWFQGSQKTLLDMFIDENSLEITVAANPSGYSTLYPRESRTRLVLQPLT